MRAGAKFGREGISHELAIRRCLVRKLYYENWIENTPFGNRSGL